ncbi:MAG: outer membrane lipoprotein carrier protein LolA [Bauldia sp.]
MDSGTSISAMWARRTVAAGLMAAICLVANAGGLYAAVHDPVPLPRPNPKLAAISAPAAPAVDSAVRPAEGFKLPKFLQPKKKAPPTGPSPFTPDQQAALSNVTTYFNSFRTMEGQFVQSGPNGEQSEGVFFISKPGKIRFHYRPPVKLDVISDGSSVAVRDNKANTQDLYPLSKTPLKYLLADDIDLTSSDVVSQVRIESDIVSVLIIQKSAFVDGKLTMIFDRKTYELKQWIVTDAQGLNTSVAVFNLSTGKRPDPGLFRIVINP